MPRRGDSRRQLVLSLTPDPEMPSRAIGGTVQRHSNIVLIGDGPPFELIRLYKTRLYAKVDPEMYSDLSLIRWRREWMNGQSLKCYAKGVVRGRDTLMHRYVMQVTDPEIIVDHRYGDTLDNRREHLRQFTVEQNNWNRPMNIDRGLRWHRLRRQWRVDITAKSRRWHVGFFDTKDEAREARRLAEIAHFGFEMRDA